MRRIILNMLSGAILKQICNSGGPNYYSHEEMKIIETGIEFLVPSRQIPTPENTAVAIAVGASVGVGVSALMNLGGFAQSSNESISKLPLPERLKDFFKFYLEKTFETLSLIHI